MASRGYDIPREAFCDVVQQLFRSLAKTLPLAKDDIEDWELDVAKSSLENGYILMEHQCDGLGRVNYEYLEEIMNKALGYDGND